MEAVNKEVYKDCFQTLSAVLRNSHQLADLLSSVRSLRSKKEREFSKMVRESDHLLNDVPLTDEELQRLSLNQETGHFIHGPKPELYMLCTLWSNPTAIVTKTKEILKEQILRLRSTKYSIIVDRTTFLRQRRPLNAAPLEKDEREKSPYKARTEYLEDEVDWKSECENLLENMNQSDSSVGNETISVNYFDETFSAEWPAVIGIVEFSRRMFCNENFVDFNVPDVISNSESVIDQLLSKIYITVSRARVYCCLILIIRDLDVYVNVRRFWDGMYLPSPGITTESAEMRKTWENIDKDFSEVEDCLKSHMVSCEKYGCQSENATTMTSSKIRSKHENEKRWKRLYKRCQCVIV